VQMNPKVGDVTGNTRKAEVFLAEAKQKGAELVVFPELSLIGYPPRDLLDFPDIIDANLASLRSFASKCIGIACVCGFVDRNPTNVGKPLYNSAALLMNGKIQSTTRKQLLPYYDVFDEERYFEPGEKALVFHLNNLKFGITICEDAWNFPEFLKRTYPTQPLETLREEKLDVLLNLSASPFSLGKPDQRQKVFAHAARFVNASVLLCNQVGGNDHLIFDGCTMALDREGNVTARARPFEESLLLVDTEASTSLAPEVSSEEEWIVSALKIGLKDYVEKCGARGICLGLSGGIDSSVCAALAVAALGPDRVVGLGLPTHFTSHASLEDAETLAKRLGIEYRVFSIDHLNSEIKKELSGWFGSQVNPVTWENVQPRLRMTVLMALANNRGLYLLNTSNKSEIATGFSTLYGDSAGALSLIGDLTKTQVYSVARHLNRGSLTIPERVLTRPPTAELRENQTDQDVLPPYDVLDRLVGEAVVELRPLSDLRKVNGSDTFLKMHLSSEYKRNQLPIVLKISPKAFGMGRRIPVAAHR
jgi:NAD+ synthase (glutamine-hydrolysing)